MRAGTAFPTPARMWADEGQLDDAVRTRRWACAGCSAVLVVLAVVVALVARGIAELEKGLDGYGQLEKADEPYGSVYDPLGPGGTARYEDGLEVTVGEPRREPDGAAYRFTVTYRNGADEPLNMGGDSVWDSVSEYGSAPLVVRAGKPGDDDERPDPEGTGRWLNQEEAGTRLLRPLGRGDRLTVVVRVAGGTKGMPVAVEVEPSSDPYYRDTAHWELRLD
ncbi:hypothetical protein GCM10010406_02010 [Streptomyces thermolineatus]|uniref:DUF4352 domain-containing protein n=2 Tax=Streptomyces thermolineatus TaxID=44033 RepID=A0ABN3KQZ8_9ACTN